MEKFRLKPNPPGQIHSQHAPNGVWYVPLMTDADVETLREHHPETFDTYFETVKTPAKNDKQG